MGFDIDRLEKHVRMLAQLPGLSVKKKAGTMEPLFPPEAISAIEDAIVEDVRHIVNDAWKEYEKIAAELEKKDKKKPEKKEEKPAEAEQKTVSQTAQTA